MRGPDQSRVSDLSQLPFYGTPEILIMNTPTPDDSSSQPQAGIRRLLPLAGAIVLGLTLVGFIEGITDPKAIATSNQADVPREGSGDVPQAVAYRQMADAQLSPNADFLSSLSALKSERPSIFDPVQRTDQMKQEALQDRLRTRAFDGAPPVIPHVIQQQSAASCLACHGEGIRMGDKVATKVSHPQYTSCTQCHVESSTSGPINSVQTTENSFTGLQRSGPGLRAYAGAPPTIPHTLWLRNDCTSCHGLVARPGLRTTHPWLSNCVQCHAASEQLNQFPFANGSL